MVMPVVAPAFLNNFGFVESKPIQVPDFALALLRFAVVLRNFVNELVAGGASRRRIAHTTLPRLTPTSVCRLSPSDASGAAPSARARAAKDLVPSA